MIGRTVGRFRITSDLGRGGMSSVWKAEDSLLGRVVALKILKPELAESPDARQRFLREARSGSRLDHPGVPTVFDYGQSEDLVYIAMALIDGETLAARAARCPMAVDEALRIVCEAARILGHAHARGVIHRDVSGRNIMIASDGRVFVLDFGLARAAGDSRITSSRTTVGTLFYMAPEVVRGGSADPRSDLYGLGVVLYEAVTGRLPFGGEHGDAAVFAALNTPPMAPRELRPDLPEVLEPVILKTFAARPEDRFQSAEEMAAALEALAKAVGSSRGPAPAPAAAILGPAPVSSGAVTPPIPRTGRGIIYLAVLPFHGAAMGDADRSSLEPLARGMAGSLASSLARLSGVAVIPPAGAGSLEGEDEPGALARKLRANLLLRGRVQRAGPRVRVGWELFDPWLGRAIAGDRVEGLDAALFEIEDRVADGIRRALGYERAPADRAGSRAPRDPAARERYLQALAYLQRADNEAAVDAAVKILERLVQSEGETAEVMAKLGHARMLKYRICRDRSWESLAAAACQRALELDPEAPEALETLGEVHLSAGRYEEAIQDYRRAWEKRPDSIEALLGLARAQEAAGRLDEAEATGRAAVSARPDDWRAHSRLGILCFNQGRYEEAIEPFRRVVQLTADNARGHYNLGSALYHLDRFDEALAAYRRSIEIQPNARAFTNLGTVLFTLRRYEESALAFEKATALSPSDPVLWGNLGSALRWVPGREAGAREALERAVALMRERLEWNPRDGESWARLSAWLANLRQDAESITAIERALELVPEDVKCMATAGGVYNYLGDRPRALHWLREAVRRGYGVEKLRRDPELAPLREDPEFVRILNEGSGRRGAETEDRLEPGGAA